MKKIPFPTITPIKVTGAYGSAIAPMLKVDMAPLPYMLTFVVTRRCNSKCRMCNIWQEKRPPELSLEQIQTIFAQGFPYIQALTLTGGEATLRQDLPEIFDAAARNMPNLQLLYLATSGLNTRLTLGHVRKIAENLTVNPRRVKRFEVQISLDGDEDDHDNVRGIEGYFKAVMATVKGLDQLREEFPFLNYHFNMVMMPRNLGSVSKVKEIARGMGKKVTFSPIIISSEYYRNESQSQDLLFTTRSSQALQAAQMLEEIAAEEQGSLKYYYHDVAEMVNGKTRSRRCMQGYYAMVLEHNANVYPCVNYEITSFGNLLEERFTDIWFSDKATQLRASLKEHGCPNCPAMCYTSAANVAELAATTVRTALGALARKP